MNPAFRAIFVVGAVVMLGGCQSLEAGAKDDFSSSKTCPLERVEVRERPELKPSSFSVAGKPPADIAADPDRLKMWLAQQNKQQASSDSGETIFEARGCGKHEFMRCHRMKGGDAFCMSETDRTGKISTW